MSAKKFILTLLLLNNWINDTKEDSFFKCANYGTQRDFKIDKFQGTWYEYGRLPMDQGHCVTFLLTKTSEESMQIASKVNRKKSTQNRIKGVLTDDLTDTGNGKFYLNTVPYWILNTDYEHFAVVYSCVYQFGVIPRSTFWILTREQHPSLLHVAEPFELLRRNGVNTAKFQTTNQVDCDSIANDDDSDENLENDDGNLENNDGNLGNNDENLENNKTTVVKHEKGDKIFVDLDDSDCTCTCNVKLNKIDETSGRLGEKLEGKLKNLKFYNKTD